MSALDKQQLIRWITSEIAHTGRRYRIDWAALDLDSLLEMQRLIRDLDDEKQMAANRARLMPWRRP